MSDYLAQQPLTKPSVASINKTAMNIRLKEAVPTSVFTTILSDPYFLSFNLCVLVAFNSTLKGE